MRVIEPKRPHGQQVYRKHSPKRLIVVVGLLVVVCIFGYGFYSKSKTNTTEISDSITDTNSQDAATKTATPAKKSGALKQFTGQEFKDLYYQIAYPNTQQINEKLDITGNSDADDRIRSLAEDRGYKQTVIPQGSIVKINEPRLNGDDLLQPLAAKAWEELKKSAAADGIALSIISAYRSPDWQRDLFTERLYSGGTNAVQVAGGIADRIVNATLSAAAVPGYSRHHTGYTIDLWCEDGSGTFANSSCYRWISADNYLKAKQTGWIPSYPEGTDLQGPEPEPWEYVWVGTEALTE